MGIVSHAEIDFVDVHIDTDNLLYIDPERVTLSSHPFAKMASEAIADFFDTLCHTAASRDRNALYHLLSFGREPNETHLGFSTFNSRGNGTSPEILMPIIDDMISSGLFEAGLVTQLTDLQLWTPRFHYDRMSDLVTNIIRDILVEYTYLQYRLWDLALPSPHYHLAPSWDTYSHAWVMKKYPHFLNGQFATLLVPKCFVGRYMLSSPGELLHKYALRYRQQEHLDIQSSLCHRKQKANGAETIMPPTKRELYDFEVKGRPTKMYLRDIGNEHPHIVRELHADHCAPACRNSISISDAELDMILYTQDNIAI